MRDIADRGASSSKFGKGGAICVRASAKLVRRVKTTTAPIGLEPETIVYHFVL